MRVRVDGETLAPVRVPEYLGGDKMMDDFLLDEEVGVAYVTTPRKNNIEPMFLEPDRNEERESLAGNPFDEDLVGPSQVLNSGRPRRARPSDFRSDPFGTVCPTGLSESRPKERSFLTRPFP
jgi:hypothetical protein